MYFTKFRQFFFAAEKYNMQGQKIISACYEIISACYEIISACYEIISVR